MSLPRRTVQSSWFDVEWLAGGLFPAGSPYRVFREKVLPALAKARPTLAGLYCAENGRTAIEPVLLAGVTMLHFLEKAPDRQASDAVRLHLGWKLALGLEVGYAGFDASSLSVFRGRLVEGGAERVVFDAVLERLREAGLVRRRAKQRLDSTHVLGWVSAMSRLDVVRETLRLAIEALAREGVGDGFERWPALAERYLGEAPDWRHATKEELIEKVRQAGEDALALLGWLDETRSPLREAKAIVLLRRVFAEQFEVVEGRPRQRAKEGSGTVKNPHDPDAQWATKKKEDKKGWVGYKAQVAETVPEDGQPQPKGEPTEQFVTEVTTTEAIASDLDGMGRPCPKSGILPADQFDVDLAARQATCPAGKTSTQCSLVHDADQGTTYWRFEWGRQCDECPLRPRCTKSESGRRILAVGEHHDLLQARRREMATEAFPARMHSRNAIEGTISELVRLGLRRSRYRGLAKTRLANYLLGAACNVRRWQRLEARRAERAAQAG
jgi:hypothetical protein